MKIRKLFRLFDFNQKVRIGILFVMMLIGAVFETVGISLIMPIITIAMNPKSVENGAISYFYKLFGFDNVNSFLILIIFTLIAVYIIKNLYLYLMYHIQYKFIYNNRFKMSNNLFHEYVHMPYEFYLNSDTGELLRIIGMDTTNLFNLLTNILQLLTEGVVFVVLVSFLLFIDIWMTISIALLMGIAMILTKKVFKSILLKAGKNAQKSSGIMNKWLLHAFEGIKELKITHREKFFINKYEVNGKINTVANRINSVLGIVPRLIIEVVGICGMLGFIAVLLLRGADLSNMIALLSAFAMAAVRLMPCVNRMSSFINGISFYEPSLDVIEGKLKKYNIDKSKLFKNQQQKNITITCNNEVKLNNITYSYPNTSAKVFDDACMTIPAGKSIGIVGVSGSGKTTIVDILLGLLTPQNGTITTDGTNIMDNYIGWLDKIGYIPQTIFMVDDSIRNNIAFGMEDSEIDNDRITQVLKKAQLYDFVNTLQEGVDTVIGEKGVRLSGGQRQRIGIARALYHNPEILVFDEATSALDNDTEAAIMEAINGFQGEKTMIIIAHRLGTIKNCDIIYRVTEGKIVEIQKSELF